MGAQDQNRVRPARDVVDHRRHPRCKLEVDINIYTRTCGALTGHTLDISEAGIAVMLRTEVPLGEVVNLEFSLPLGPVTTYAVARQRNAFRYGFQFLESSDMEVIRSSCRDFAVEQNLRSLLTAGNTILAETSPAPLSVMKSAVMLLRRRPIPQGVA